MSVTQFLNNIKPNKERLPRNESRSFSHVAVTLDKRLAVHLDKEMTVIHIDGEPSIQKSAERKSRQERLNKDLAKLKDQVAKLCERKHGSPAKLFRKCRDLYRPPPSDIDGIEKSLKDLGWTVCRCHHQADTHIGQICRDVSDKSKLAVVTGDSDLIIYDGVPNVTMPVGRAHEWTTFSKDALIEDLNLPSSRHLLLTAVVTKNDYFPGIKTYGIRHNADLVRGIDIDMGQGESTEELMEKFRNAIDSYLDRITEGKATEDKTTEDKVLKGKVPKAVTTSDYEHALKAFVLCQEDSSASATPSSQTHHQICDLLKQLENFRLRRRGLSQTSSSMASSSSCGAVVMASSSSSGSIVVPTSCSGTVIAQSSQDQNQNKPQDLVKKKRLSRWRRARFKSPNQDKNPRYSPHVVKDITNARHVDAATLSKLKPSEPRPHKSRRKSEDAADVAADVENAIAAQDDVVMEEEDALFDTTMDTVQYDITIDDIDKGDISMEGITKVNIVECAADEDAPTKDDSNEDPVDEEAKAAVIDAKQAKKKNITRSNQQSKERKKQATSSRPTNKAPTRGESKQVKDLVAKTFKTVSLTLGCLTGTLRRATSMNQHEARAIADRINIAVHVLSKARILVFKGIEDFIYQELESLKPKDAALSSMVGPLESSSSMDTSMTNPVLGTSESKFSMDASVTNPALGTSAAVDTSMNPLDLLLNPTHGKTLIRNLGSLIVNGSITQGRVSNNPHGRQARDLAKQIYEKLRKDVTLPLKSMVDGKMSISVPNAEMAVNIYTAIDVHFERLPEVITTR
ncbi:hypothetical protein BGX34_005554, partial [Mortierella sp. NVP85]